jgi:hypothetical protein
MLLNKTQKMCSPNANYLDNLFRRFELTSPLTYACIPEDLWKIKWRVEGYC